MKKTSSVSYTIDLGAGDSIEIEYDGEYVKTRLWSGTNIVDCVWLPAEHVADVAKALTEIAASRA